MSSLEETSKNIMLYVFDPLVNLCEKSNVSFLKDINHDNNPKFIRLQILNPKSETLNYQLKFYLDNPQNQIIIRSETDIANSSNPIINEISVLKNDVFSDNEMNEIKDNILMDFKTCTLEFAKSIT